MAKIQVFTLQNADARQMAELLTSLFRCSRRAGPPPATSARSNTPSVRTGVGSRGRGGGIRLGHAGHGGAKRPHRHGRSRTNSLLVGGTEHYVALVAEIIETLDSSPAQERKTEVYRLRNGQAHGSADSAAQLPRPGPAAHHPGARPRGGRHRPTAARTRSRHRGRTDQQHPAHLRQPPLFRRAQAAHRGTRPAPAAGAHPGVLAEVTLDNSTDLGVEWTYTGSGNNVLYGLGSDFGVARDLASMGGFSAAVSGSDYTFLLRALETDGRLQVLSRPQILTADNQAASINVGQRIPLITDSRVTAQDDTINCFKYEDVGVNLTVTPRISPDGFVKLEVGTTNSVKSLSTVDISPGVSVPIINQRRATTTVTVQSGQSILIGGLIFSSDDRRTRKVPLLGDVPLLGFFFRSRTTVQSKKELLIVLTPQVLVNVDEKGRVIDAGLETRQQLERSSIGGLIERDPIQRQILDPLFQKDLISPERVSAPSGKQ